MSGQVRLIVRHETRTTECRAPVVPADAARLVAAGMTVTVERSAQRVFPIEEYARAGCAVAEPGSWVDAPTGDYVVGLKELPDSPARLRHRHVFFGHAYKGQQGAMRLLRRFTDGGGALLDLEYLVDDAGRRLAAFGYWAGYAGAALAVLHARDRLPVPLEPLTRSRLDGLLHGCRSRPAPRTLVVGALGRCGHGARDALAVAGIDPTCWDVAETRELDRAALLGHDLLVNTVLATRPVPPFVTRADLAEPSRRLSIIADVSCDVTSALNVLPVYECCTTWARPVLRVAGGAHPLSVIALDNLPSLLPAEASVAFSAALTPLLCALGGTDPVWRRCQDAFDRACRTLELETTDD